MPDGGITRACIVITSDEEELAGGTVDLASLLVRRLSEVGDDAIKLVAVDVNGVGSEAPVRISIDDLPSWNNGDVEGVMKGFQAMLGHQAEFEDTANAVGAVKIAMSSLELPATKPFEDEGGPIAASIRIAMPDRSCDEASLPHLVSGPAHPWKMKPPQRGEAVAGEIRISAAILASGGGRHGPRISIP